MSPEQLLDDLERWAREVQRCSAGDSAAARRARGKLKFARQQALGFMLQKELEVKALQDALLANVERATGQDMVEQPESQKP